MGNELTLGGKGVGKPKWGWVEVKWILVPAKELG